MRSSEIVQRAKEIIDPDRQEMEDAFRAAFSPIVYRRGISDSERDRALEKLSSDFIHHRISLVSQALVTVVRSTKSMLSEEELRASFHELCPTLADFRSFIFSSFTGLALGVPVSAVIAIERTFARRESAESKQLALLGYDVSMPELFKRKRLIFVSCGQFAAEERALGKELAALIKTRTEYEGYFAQNQESLDGVTTHILGALGACVGFVGVMHDRGEVTTPDGTMRRGSVWVEQEIAIVSYRVQVLGHQLALATYVQEGIELEGIRQALILNSRRFKTSSDVLSDFSKRLADGSFCA
jgi:hypothetical protein